MIITGIKIVVPRQPFGSTLVGSFTFSISIGTDTSQSGRVILGAGTSFMSERFAKEVGVRILNDSLTINSTLPGAMNGQMGTVENMQIGSMIFHYPLITVAPPNALDSVMRVDAILGMDFINLFDELRIYPKEKKIVFPVSSTPLPASGRNMILTDRALKIKAEANNGERLKLHFDTGCSTAGLYYR